MKSILRFFLIIFLLQSFVLPSYALTLAPDSRYYSEELLGQRHYYSVYFRGNGEAVVSYKVQITNTSSHPITSVVYEIPENVQLNNIIAYQVYTYIQPCYPYDTPTFVPMQAEPDLHTSTPTPFPMATKAPGTMNTTLTPEPALIQRAPCLYEKYPSYGGNSYQEVSYTLDGQKLTVNLLKSIQPNNSGAFFLTYRSPSFVTKALTGAYSYTFETLKAHVEISSLQVGITTEQELFLKDAASNINYNEVRSSPAMLPQTLGSTLQNQELDNYYNQIGQGTIYKYASHLSEGESYSVKGMYADAVWKLHIKEVIVGILVFIVILLLLLFFVRVFMNHVALRKHVTEKSSINKMTDAQRRIFITTGVSFGISLLVSVFTILVYVMGRSLNSFVPYYFEGQAVIFLLFMLVSASIYVILLLIPAILWGVRYGIWWAVTLFVLTVAWLAFYVIIMLFGMFVFYNNRLYSVPPISQMSEDIKK